MDIGASLVSSGRHSVSKSKERCNWMNQERLYQLVGRHQTVILENMNLTSIIPTDQVIFRIIPQYASIIISELRGLYIQKRVGGVWEN